MLEHEIQNKIRLKISAERLATIFRANVGEGYAGEEIIKNADGSITIKRPRRFKTGLPTGFPDLFGLKSITITPDMVGKKIAVFAFIEVKQPKKKPTKVQENMIDFLLNNGAIGGVAHSDDEAAEKLR